MTYPSLADASQHAGTFSGHSSSIDCLIRPPHDDVLQDDGTISATWCQLQESDELLQRQFEELSKGLQDEAPAVCITAASGICALLNTYWELIPAGITAAYLKHLTGMSAVTLPSRCSGHHFQLVFDGMFFIA